MVQNHTVTHALLPGMSYEAQRAEICRQSDIIQKEFGYRPSLFRPPYGEYDDTTRRAVADCGMKAIVTWSVKVNGGYIQYQEGDRFRPGDIVLMHFREQIIGDLKAFTAEVKKRGLHVVKLEDWIR